VREVKNSRQGVVLSYFCALIANLFPGLSRGIEKVLMCEIGFQDLEKVLILAKMYIRH